MLETDDVGDAELPQVATDASGNGFDGAALYLNGEEIGRWNLPDGAIGPDTPASGPQLRGGLGGPDHDERPAPAHGGPAVPAGAGGNAAGRRRLRVLV